MSELAKDYICPSCAQETASPSLHAFLDVDVCEPCAVESWIEKAQELHGTNERLRCEIQDRETYIHHLESKVEKLKAYPTVEENAVLRDCLVNLVFFARGNPHILDRIHRALDWKPENVTPPDSEAPE